MKSTIVENWHETRKSIITNRAYTVFVQMEQLRNYCHLLMQLQLIDAVRSALNITKGAE
jgi:hypothetical protein